MNDLGLKFTDSLFNFCNPIYIPYREKKLYCAPPSRQIMKGQCFYLFCQAQQFRLLFKNGVFPAHLLVPVMNDEYPHLFSNSLFISIIKSCATRFDLKTSEESKALFENLS